MMNFSYRTYKEKNALNYSLINFCMKNDNVKMWTFHTSTPIKDTYNDLVPTLKQSRHAM